MLNENLAIVEGIMQGLADAAAGPVTPHEQVMAQAHAIIDEAERKRAARG